jgi:tagaturonate epimerase
MLLEKYSLGIGDRFGRQGKAQLEAIIQARALGIDLVPVWNKSFREHQIIGTQPSDTRREAEDAVQSSRFQSNYYVDADHINLGNVATFLDCSDFFTIDVAESIGSACDFEDTAAFLSTTKQFLGKLEIPGIDGAFDVTDEVLSAVAETFLGAVKEAGRIYRHIRDHRGKCDFVTEVSMDESDSPQTPMEMFFILAALAAEGIPAQTVAPKFSGRFNKGVDYVGDASRFAREFTQDVAVLEYAKTLFELPQNLKLSVHSGSDKFSIYGPINQALKRFDAGVHVKTAGTTWLEELIGLAEAGDAGLVLAQDIYARAYEKSEALCAPYATVIDIDPAQLPAPAVVNTWNREQYVDALRHDTNCPHYNLHLRQLLHVGYKIAADMGDRYDDALTTYQESISRNVTENILTRHIKPIFS